MQSPELTEGLKAHREGRLGEAEAVYLELLKAQPDHADGMHLLGLIRGEQGLENEAIRLIESAIRQRPSAAAYHHNIAGLYRRVGQMTSARAAFEQAFLLKEDYGEAYQGFAEVVTFAPGDEFLNRVLGQLALKTLDDRTRCYLHFAAGKFLDDTESFDAAFNHYRLGNQLAGRDYDTSENRRLFQNLVYYAPELRPLSKPRKGMPWQGPAPIFVVGMPRSGTSLVEQILASHSSVFGAGELNHLARVSTPLLSALLQSSQSMSGQEAEDPRWYLSRRAEAAGKDYLERIQQGVAHRGEPWIVDKHPLNFRFIGLIKAMLPRAKIIHVRRHPLDTCLSCFFQNFTQGQNYSFDLTTLGHFYRDYQKIMTHWANEPETQFYALEYEALLSAPEETISALLDYCELPFEPGCLKFYETKRPVSTASFKQVRQPLYHTSKQRWMNYAEQLRPLARILGLEDEIPIRVGGSKL